MGTDADAMPSRVGPWEIVLPIASGGMATVYLARPLSPSDGPGGTRGDRYFALKLAPSRARRDPGFARRLLEEASLTRELRHPNVVAAFEVGKCDEGVYLVMEYVPGDSLAGLGRRARATGTELSRRVGLKILVDALHGLHAAHEHVHEAGRPLQIVHRDFTPSNILVGTDGVARLTDFGIAKAASRLPTTEPGITREEIRYLAPEQVRGEELDRRCDVWAAGVIAWELLTGRPLYDKDDPSVLGGPRDDPPHASTVASDVSAALDDAVARALAVDRERRTSSALAFADELAAAAAASGTLAAASEVAELVTRLVQPELAERRELLEDMRKRPRSAPDVRTMIGMTGPLVLERPPLASLPDLPPPIDEGGSELRIEVRLDAKAAERAELDILGQPSAPAPQVEEEPAVFRSPVVVEPDVGGAPEDAAPAGLGRGSRSAVAPPALAGRARATVARWVAPPWTTKKISIGTGLAGGIIGFLLVLVAVSGRKESEAKPAASSSAAAPPIAALASKDDAPPESPPAAAELDDEPTPILQIRANAPIASVKVVDRFVDAVVPTPTLNVDLEDDELDRALRITVTGTDGRVAIATAESGARELDVTFGPRPRPAARPAATPASTVKHPWSKRSR